MGGRVLWRVGFCGGYGFVGGRVLWGVGFCGVIIYVCA